MENHSGPGWRSYSVTLIILAVNIIGYILCTQTGEAVYTIGSINAEKILVEKQYYRFATAIFLHADIDHIVGNMIYLIGLGQMIEPLIGHIRFVILYLLSGLGAGIFSILYSVLTGGIYDAVGASGAIFGLIGALFILVAIRDLRRRAHRQAQDTGHMADQPGILDADGQEIPRAYDSISIGRLIFVVIYMIYSGARAARVDNAAHVGGLVSGLLIMAVMNLIKNVRYGT